MLGRTFCPLGDAAAMPTISIVEKFRDEIRSPPERQSMPYHPVAQADSLPVLKPPDADLVKLTIDGKPIEAAPGTLVIDAAKRAGIEIPAFCYGKAHLQAACRMCLVEVEKMPKLMASCTLPVAEGMVVRTETPQVAQARKSTLEFLLTNHPLDCPVCDKGGECELQDMVFRYGAGESRYEETKLHVDEKAVVPGRLLRRAALHPRFRCVRICNEGMESAHSESSTARSSPRSPPTTKIISSATSAACASTSARSAR